MDSEEPKDDAPPVTAILCEDEALAGVLHRMLRRSEYGIPCLASTRPDGRGVVQVPTPMLRTVLALVRSLPNVVAVTVPDGGESYFRLLDPSRDDVISDHDVLRQTPAQLRARMSQATEELELCVRKGSEPIVERAVVVLGRLGPEARPALERLLLAAVSAANAPLLGLLLRNGVAPEERAGELLPDALRPLRELAVDGNPDVRRLAVRALAAVRARDTAAELAHALLDESPDVAIEADDAFLEWGAQDLGFDPEMADDEKRAIAEKRKIFRIEG